MKKNYIDESGQEYPNSQSTQPATHTPTPWDLMEGKTLIHIETPNKGDGSPWGEHIASLPKPHKQDAAFIVKCVNLHEELRRELEREHRHYQGSDMVNGRHTYYCSTCEAIAKAEGK